MCIVFIAIQRHPEYPLIIAANRDEFYQRPTQSSQFWHDSPTLLAGRDLQAGGSWMGVTREGHIAALTNIRDPSRENANSRSRGELVVDYLQQPNDIEVYRRNLSKSRTYYNGYNLLYGHYQHLAVYNNFEDSLTLLKPGVHGLSNAQINTPWPKITKGTALLEDYISSHQTLDTDTLFDLLKDDQQASAERLPNTGVPLEWEEHLSSIFIRSEEYGTRSSTLLLVDVNRNISWFEKTFSAPSATQNHEPPICHYEWKIPQQ